MLTMSASIAELAAALALAQKEMTGALKDSHNPFFKSKYADLAAVWGACRGPLAAHGLAVVQSPHVEDFMVSVETLLLHSSGHWIRGTVSAQAKDNAPQAIGSAITYLRRYALQSFVGVAPEDDDGEAAQARDKVQKGATPQPAPVSALLPPAGFDAWWADMRAVADEGLARLEAAWKESSPKFREHVRAMHATRWTELKEIAAKVPVTAANAPF